MNVITLEEQAFYTLLQTVIEELGKQFGQSEPWIGETETMQLLGIKSKTTLQRLRDNDCIRFSQPSKKLILYYKPSLYEYLEANANT